MRARTSSFVLTFIAVPSWASSPRLSSRRAPRQTLRPAVDAGPGYPKRPRTSLRPSGARRSSLAGLLLQNLADVPDALLLVGVGLSEPADLGRDLSDSLAID